MRDTQLLKAMYYTMKKIRHFEESAEELYRRGTIVGMPLHLYIGEEAVATGVCLALRKDDYITSTHRGHGHLIAKSANVGRLMAELYGRRTGYCKGKGGTMHAADLSLGVLGANGIVGGGFGIATGAALSTKKRGSDQVSICFFGDGASNQGIFMEVMNMAALWKLPVVYVCENNTFGEYSRCNDVTADRPLSDRPAAFGIPAVQVDGNDVLAVYDKTMEAVSHARAGKGPYFVEAHTYRFRGHSAGDIGFSRRYRTAEEVEERRKQDPLPRFSSWLVQQQVVSPSELEEIDQQVAREIQEAITFAANSPEPTLSELTEDVYA